MREKIDYFLEKIMLVVLILMLLSVVWQVFSRFILRSPSTITDELSSFSLIWLGLLGAAYATGKHLHLAIDLISEKVVAKKQLFFDAVMYISVIVMAFCIMVVGGIRLCQLSFQFGQKSATLQIPLGFIYIVVPLAGLLICYYSIDTFIDKRKTKKS